MLDLLNIFACMCLLLSKNSYVPWHINLLEVNFVKNYAAFNWVIFIFLDKYLYLSGIKVSFTISFYVRNLNCFLVYLFS